MKLITIKIKERTIVKPANSESPIENLWLSNVDIFAAKSNVPIIYFYNHNDVAEGFFEAAVLKESLSRILVPYYPLAGRLRVDDFGRLRVECNGEGAVFIEAETSAVVADFRDFGSTLEMSKLVPAVDRSAEVSSLPILLVQITNFKCGGVSLGIDIDHRLVDDTSRFTFINLWSQLSRDLINPKGLTPVFDRTFLRARNPPQPDFYHSEYSPSSNNPKLQNIDHVRQANATIVTNSFKINAYQLNALKEMSKANGNTINYSAFEILAGHIWKCTCMARALPEGQETKLYMTRDGRAELLPRPPPNFFGNANFAISAAVRAGDLASKPLSFIAREIRYIRLRIDSNYLSSAIDFLELNQSSFDDVYGNPNIEIINWVKLPLYGADFGWGRPIYVGPAKISYEGKSYILRASGDDEIESLLVVIALQVEDMKGFEKLLFQQICFLSKI